MAVVAVRTNGQSPAGRRRRCAASEERVAGCADRPGKRSPRAILVDALRQGHDTGKHWQVRHGAGQRKASLRPSAEGLQQLLDALQTRGPLPGAATKGWWGVA